MTSTREGVNPLRPYYIPPTIGERSESYPPQPNPFSHANTATTPTTTITTTTTTSPTATTSNGYASKARDIFSDIDYQDYLNDSSPSTVQAAKALVDELLWKYTSVLMAQPFEVAKTILQVRSQDDPGELHVGSAATHKSTPILRSTPILKSTPILLTPEKSVWDDDGTQSDSEDEEQNYFTSKEPYSTPSPSNQSQLRRPSSPLESPNLPPSKPVLAPHHLGLRRPDSIFDVISQLWSKEGAWGVWKGTNATFLYTVLQSLLENWSRSLLSALLNVPDLGVKDDVDRLVDIASPYPWASLCVAAAAAVASGLILAPLDLVRTRLIVTSTTRGSRRTVATLRALPSWFCPAPLIGPTVLNALVHPLITLSTPLVLRSQFLIDRSQSPTTFSVAKLSTSCASLFVKLPLETVLRRGQVAVLRDPAYVHAVEGDKAAPELDTIVQPGAYSGVVGTMYGIVAEEGSRAVVTPQQTKQTKGHAAKAGGGKKAAINKGGKVAETVYRKGQGLDGLWRGWKVSWWGLVGLWMAGVAGAGGEGEF
ncbi:hypothetical protein DL763_002923 [Monosporascus cannonballus]|nr:hypothetical protein DL763_002923 [Monosporascus cannonballus]